jgi:formylglycine-generating enzyme required for sulfatase activity
MAIITCNYCKGKISDKANICPHCTAPVSGPADQTKSTNHFTENTTQDKEAALCGITDSLAEPSPHPAEQPESALTPAPVSSEETKVSETAPVSLSAPAPVPSPVLSEPSDSEEKRSWFLSICRYEKWSRSIWHYALFFLLLLVATASAFAVKDLLAHKRRRSQEQMEVLRQRDAEEAMRRKRRKWEETKRQEEAVWKSKFTVYTGWSFDELEAKRRQRETAQGLGIPVEKTVTIPGGAKMEFVLIPAGEFMMGSPSSERGHDNDEALHKVRITRPFYFAKTECTQGQWKSVTGSSPYERWKSYTNTNLGERKRGSYRPVEHVSYGDIINDFLPKVQSSAPNGMRFVLPTEAQWEYACRAGTSTPFYFGRTIWISQVNYDYNFLERHDGKAKDRRDTADVGSFAPNAWSLYDMHGNVAEWCRDWYYSDYYKNSDRDDPVNLNKSKSRVHRGGAHTNIQVSCRSANRGYSVPEIWASSYGFRLALEFK